MVQWEQTYSARAKPSTNKIPIQHLSATTYKTCL